MTEKWIPVQDNQKITLRTLLCSQGKYSLALNRDDMELACLQMIICMVQVIFMPNNFNLLEAFYNNPMDGENYDKGVSHFQDWFDVLHPKYPFMQTINKKKETSLQKLFIGLPEKSSTSGSSNAHFNRVDELKEIDLGRATIALFQQATNGFSLGGRAFTKGLKGSMPITTLIYDESQNLRKTVWCNILDKKLLEQHIGNQDVENKPSWVKPIAFNKNRPEYAHKIGLLRGLFYQPAKVKLEVNEQRKATGFFKEPGLSYIEGFWRHPHTPIGWKKNENKHYYISVNEKYLWKQMLSLLYTVSDQEGYSRALVVDHYVNGIGRGKSINLSVGGYIKGKSTESLAGRKHEIYSLKSGWSEKQGEIIELVKCALKAGKLLNDSIYSIGKNLKSEYSNQGKEGSNFIKKQLQPLTKQIYFNNSESLIHETLRNLDFNKIQAYKKQFCSLAKNTFKETTQSYEHDPKLLKAIEYGRKYLNRKLNTLLVEGRRNAA
ncbi:MAG: type I-E CRISPR-associated protein Cse1/CasA [Bdellovibrionales bacterium]|nr:type I-E CRISPR-associated protein Cse1/CasA [Bdellovibrionales bacterium]